MTLHNNRVICEVEWLKVEKAKQKENKPKFAGFETTMPHRSDREILGFDETGERYCTIQQLGLTNASLPLCFHD